MHRLVFSVPIILALAGLSSATKVEAWRYAKEGNLEILSRTSNSDTREIYREIKLFPRLIEKFIGELPEENQHPKLLVIVDNAHALRSLMPEPYRDTNVTSFYWENIHLDLMVTFHDPGRIMLTHDRLYKEYSLKLMSPFNFPSWFKVGFSELLGNFELQRNHAEFGYFSIDQLSILESEGPIPISEFLQIRPTFSPNEYMEKSRYYAQSMLMVHFFLFAVPESTRKQFFKYILTEESHRPGETGFKEALGYTFNELEAALKKYLNKRNYASLSYSIKTLDINDKIEIKAIPPLKESAMVARAEISAGHLDRAYLKIARDLANNEPVSDLYRTAHFLYLYWDDMDKAQTMAERAIHYGDESVDLKNSLELSRPVILPEEESEPE